MDVDVKPKRRLDRARIEAERMLDRLVDDFPDNPEAMGYFYDLYRTTWCAREAPHRGGPAIGTLCVQVPEELIRAAGAVPVRLCDGFHAHDQQGAEFMPAKSCPLVKATLGVLQSRESPLLDGIEWIVNPTTCDQKTKAGAVIEELGYHVHTLEMPPVKDSEDGREYWRRSIERFAVALGGMTGTRVTAASLRRAIADVQAAQHEYRRLHALRRLAPAPILGKDVFLATNAYFFDDIGRWTRAMTRLNAEVERRIADGFAAAQRRAPRILFTGSPPIFPNLKLPLLIEQSGAVVVADETCSSNRMLNDQAAVDEWHAADMIEALADRTLKPCTCPIYSRNDDRKRRLIELARTYAVDGVVYQAFAGCHVYEMEYRSISQALASADVPVLYVETDYGPDDLGQLSTRIEAFVESLKARRTKRKAS